MSASGGPSGGGTGGPRRPVDGAAFIGQEARLKVRAAFQSDPGAAHGADFRRTRAPGSVGMSLRIGAALFALIAWRRAWAYTVAVEPPDQTDQVLVEAFSRLCGELSMYGLDVRAPAQAGSEALGGVSFVRTAGQPTANIWIPAPSAPDRLMRITITVADADAPSLLAIRAADVLRASLRDFRGLVLPAPPPAAATAKAAPPATPTVGRPTWPWTATASATSLFDPAQLGLGLAPSVEMRRRLGDRLFVMVDVTGPVVGHMVTTNVASARVREVLATAGLAARLAEGPRAALDVFMAVGPAYLSVHGEALPPWTAADSSTWAAISAAGVRVALRLTSRLAVSASSAAVLILPRPVLDVGPDSYAVGQPLILSNLGLDVAF